jgi:hypothetical protein
MNLPDHPLFDVLKSLGLPAADFAVFGSGPLWLRGLREGKDIDLIARGAAWNQAATLAPIQAKPDGSQFVRLAGGAIEVFNAWAPGTWDTDALIDTADEVAGIRFVKLDQVQRWKQLLGRDKDRADLVLIDQYLKENL